MREAIDECEQMPPTYTACQKLSVFYTLYDYLYGEQPMEREYSAAAERISTAGRIVTTGQSDFLRAANGKDMEPVLRVIDDLLDTIHVLNARVYNNTIEKIRNCPE